jgi:CIC family chloride channel protein
MFFRNQILALFPSRSRPLIESGLYGLAAGFAAVAFEVAIYRLYYATLVQFSNVSGMYFALASFGLMMSTSLASGYLLTRFAPEAAGSGIPQLKLAFWKDFGFIPWRIAWVKFVAGILAIGGGASLGREGPSVQLAGAVASNLSGVLGTAKTGRRRAAAAGAAAGLLGLVPLVLLVGKLAATACSYGSGGCGGVFSPSLFFGAMTGCTVGELFRALGLPVSGEDRLLLMIIGMSSCLGAVVRAPFTSILIVFEMTREFSLIPALLLAGILSQSLSRWLLPHGFYEQVLVDDGQVLSQVMPPRDFREWEKYPVSAIANYEPVVLHKLDMVTLSDYLNRFPYSRFVYEAPDSPPGIILRQEAIQSAHNSHIVPVHAVPTCLRTDAIVKVQRLLVDSMHGVAIVLDRDAGHAVGLVTLHDLLRAQHQFAAQHDE